LELNLNGVLGWPSRAGFLLAIRYPLRITVQIVLSLSIPFFLGIVVIVGGYVAFNANVIQFGLDQLHDASTDDSVLYIHWYVWTSYLGLSLVKICTSFLYADFLYIIILSMLGIIAIATCFLGVTIYAFTSARGVSGLLLIQDLKIPTSWFIKSLSLQKITLIQFVAVPSPTVRMSFPPGLTWVRRNMEDPSQPNRWRMSKLSWEFYASY
jgi:hypothetical protein